MSLVSRLRLLAALVLLAALPLASFAHPRPADPLDAAGIRIALARLHVTGSVLYVAAHPDDENTAMLAWFAREKKVRTAYLSMTRGDGGQNLIGNELGAELGVIRTQELLAARHVDGAEQMFTRALDFGFTKNPEETFAFWGRDSVLSDVVWAIRKFQPDVIITRFPTDGGGGHGHHTASAILAEEAFRVAADSKAFPQQFALGVKPWQAKRLFWNAWTPEGTKLDSTWVKLDVGTYNPLLGRSYGEIAAASRSNHKSQGFGVPERHGPLPSYLVLREGAPVTNGDPFDGVAMGWSRVDGGARVDQLLADAERGFDAAHPQALLPMLFEAREAMAHAATGDAAWARARRAELDDLIRSVSGLWIEAVATRPTVTPGESLAVVVTLVNRLGVDATVKSVALGATSHGGARLAGARSDTLVVPIPASAPLTQPYWLESPSSRGLFAVRERAKIGLPENPPALSARITLSLADGEIAFDVPVAYRWADPVQGERWRGIEIAPPATLELDHAVYAFPDRAPRTVQVRVQAQRAGVKGRVRLELPAGWSATPATTDVALAKAGEETTASFSVTPGAGPASSSLTASVEIGGQRWAQRLERIDYPHIPIQTLFPPATARAVRADIRHEGARIAYVAGPGDAIPDALAQLGYEVVPLSDGDLERADLSRFDAVVTGARAYNTRPRLRAAAARLMEYVRNGGTLLTQYNTTADGPLGDIGPYPFTISRDRVTVEEAPVTFAHAEDPVLRTPNTLATGDFDGWVQERGLYFANPWDPRYVTPLSCHDPGEPARDGGLLVARYGKGVYSYCAYALFRQLPAGVPGAWRLLANLVSARGLTPAP